MEKSKFKHYLNVNNQDQISLNLMYQKVDEVCYGFIFGYSGGGQYIDGYFTVDASNKVKLKDTEDKFRNKKIINYIDEVISEGYFYHTHKNVSDEIQMEMRGLITSEAQKLKQYSRTKENGWVYFTDDIDFEIIKRVTDKSDLLIYFE